MPHATKQDEIDELKTEIRHLRNEIKHLKSEILNLENVAETKSAAGSNSQSELDHYHKLKTENEWRAQRGMPAVWN